MERCIHFCNQKLVNNDWKELILLLLESKIKYRSTISHIYQTN